MQGMNWETWITPAIVIAAYWALRVEIRGEIHSLRDRVDRISEDMAFLKGRLSAPAEKTE